MKLTIKTKLSLFTGIMILFVIIINSYSLFVYERKVKTEDNRNKQKEIFANFSHLSKEALILQDEVLLLNNMRALKNTYWGIEYINFILNSGRVINTDKDKSKRGEGKQYIGSRLVEQYNTGYDREFLEISAPVYINGKRLGVGQIGFSQTDFDKHIDGILKEAAKKISIIALISLVIGIVFSVFLGKRLAGPIIELATGVKSIGEGNLDTKIDIKSRDELGMLAEEFNNMAVKLAELDRAKDEFVNAVSHELRTPLAAIEGYIDFLMEAGEKLPREKQEKAFGIMKGSSQRLSRFIDDILDIAKIKSGKMSFNLETQDLKDLADKVIVLLSPMAQKKGIRFVTEIAADVPGVMGDEVRVNQVLTNLVGNALKFTPENGTITIGAKRKDANFVLVYVQDTGPGIAQEDTAKIFDQFEQAQTARDVQGPKGTGLGLAIAEGIVKAHSGKIWVESEQGVGTIFYFTLPSTRTNV